MGKLIGNCIHLNKICNLVIHYKQKPRICTKWHKYGVFC